MRSANIRGMEVTVNTEDTLETLRKNREHHSSIVKEAREGYLKQAREVLEKRMKKLESGELVNLIFRLSPPQDYTKVYDVAIKMLEMHVDSTIVLDGDQVRHMIMDEWDWMESFVGMNKIYSAQAASVALENGW